ncbi:MAG: hypothetical protein SGI88_16660 [Candidatus Hydrogenedentes bacterium]|nr:hypothetical protein [Candidatus Hydrogenedentota bacterium]
MGAEAKGRRGLRMREILAILVLIAVAALLALPVVRTTRTAVLDRTCVGNLKQWGSIFAQYRAEHHAMNPMPHGFERFGPASNAEGCTNIDDAFDYAPQVDSIFPEYSNDTAILACPDTSGVVPAVTAGPVVFKAPRLDTNIFKIAEGTCGFEGSITRPATSYTYLGFEIHRANDSDPQISLEQARKFGLPASGPATIVALLAHLQVSPNKGWEEVQRLRNYGFMATEYVQRLGYPYTETMKLAVTPLSETAKSSNLNDLGIDRSAEVLLYPTMAVMWDAIHQDAAGEPVFNHSAPAGCNVLYMDGHVEFKSFPGDFPVSKGFANMKAVR